MVTMRRRKGEEGATSAEWLALALLVAGLVAALALAAPAGIATSVRQAIVAGLCEVAELAGGDGCPPGAGDAGAPHERAAGELTDEDFQPDACEVFSRETEDRGSVKLAFVHLGADYFFIRSEHSDRETSITFVDGGEIGLTGGLGGRFDVTAGGRTYGASARASGEIYADFGNGDTWVFASPEEADRFESWLRREKNEDRRGDAFLPYGWVNGVVEWATGEEDPPEPDRTFIEGGLNAEGGAEASAGLAQVGLDGSAAVLLGEERDRRTGTRTRYYQVDFDIAGRAGLLTLQAGAGWDGSGVVKATRDADGELTELEIVDTSTGGLSGVADLDTDDLTLAGLMDELGNEASLDLARDETADHTIVSTTTVQLEEPDERAAVDDWFGLLNGVSTAGERTFDGELPDREAAVRDAVSRLLYEDSRVSVVEYDGNTTGLGLAAEIALGLKLGVDLGSSESSRQAVEAYYLGVPFNGERRLVPFGACIGG